MMLKIEKLKSSQIKHVKEKNMEGRIPKPLILNPPLKHS